ncbi:hypothetical protein [Aliirhizobium cellulosilyticum]|uniref:Uncharacterized protein n=2 Tax=Rhizobiaceae TaxID=82115 RepID=A0A7W6UWP1_9HYPH|nr:hypothetical protein [Rhizobium cellulosilyticum]MBB4346527.1 hypothetical protein [Rhizobium cellulosilyticum]MBB4411079.1 hypothetical protein [Rhizobium cellulosilyticum]MBB4445768.1 hypothetical protein [Rhizobium cellulosilyticum]
MSREDIAIHQLNSSRNAGTFALLLGSVVGKEMIVMHNYCDIMPHATGWVYVIDGVQSASFYHSYELALDAARTHLATRGRRDGRIFRCQALNGNMLPIDIAAVMQPPGTGIGPVAYR